MDTNVLFHYQFFRDVDWASELDVPELTLVFTPSVLGEIDKRKFGGSRRDKGRAKAIVKALDDLSLSSQPTQLRERVSILGIDTEPDPQLFPAHGLQPQVADDQLLASLYAFRAADRSHDRVLLLTPDPS